MVLKVCRQRQEMLNRVSGLVVCRRHMLSKEGSYYYNNGLVCVCVLAGTYPQIKPVGLQQ